MDIYEANDKIHDLMRYVDEQLDFYDILDIYGSDITLTIINGNHREEVHFYNKDAIWDLLMRTRSSEF